VLHVFKINYIYYANQKCFEFMSFSPPKWPKLCRKTHMLEITKPAYLSASKRYSLTFLLMYFWLSHWLCGLCKKCQEFFNVIYVSSFFICFIATGHTVLSYKVSDRITVTLTKLFLLHLQILYQLTPDDGPISLENNPTCWPISVMSELCIWKK